MLNTVKNLRSFIHEKIPLDLRVELDLLSRRRDLHGEEKQEEIINLFRKYNVGDISQLGPGTNRYGLKLDGFVVKVATDHDGKVDNLKEFKMAKVLFPHVPKTYEVSENGSILIAEYVLAFQSFTEMMRYQDKIREILEKLSSVFLIGDAGLTGKNFANWGLRVGSEEVVCLDFAYVYDVTSDLFICRHCNTNSMLVPNRDFTKLVCPNKACQKETKFEDIKSMISNEYHMKQIGDLSKEGYLMDSSNVMTELTEDRSNYLVRMRQGKKQKILPKSETPTDDEVVETKIAINKEEDSKMYKNELVVTPINMVPGVGGLVVSGITVTPNEPIETDATPEVEVAAEEPVRNFDNPELGDVIYEKYSAPHESTEPVTSIVFSAEIDPNVTVDLLNIEDDEDNVDVHGEYVVDTDGRAAMDMSNAPGGFPPQKEDDGDDPHSVFTENFCKQSHRAVSNFCNSIAEQLHINELFEHVKVYLGNKKMYPGEFYTEVGNAVFRSMVAYLEFSEEQVPNPHKEGTHKEFRAVYELANSDNYEADKSVLLRIIERFFNTRIINSKETFDESVQAYNAIYGDKVEGGANFALPRTWIQLCGTRLSQKIQIGSKGVIIFENSLVDLFYKYLKLSDEDESTIDGEMVAVPITGDVLSEAEADALMQAIAGADEDDDDTEDENDEEEYQEQSLQLTVEIIPDDSFDIVKLISEDAFGRNAIPIYTNLDDAVYDENNVTDSRNGILDWLTHLVPDVCFRTKNPEKYIMYNDDEWEENQCHVVVLGVDDEGFTVLAIYATAGVYVIDDDFNYVPMFQKDILTKLNYAVCNALAHSQVSHLKRTLSMKEMIHDEEYANQFFITSTSEESDDEEVLEDESTDAGDSEETVEEELVEEVTEDDEVIEVSESVDETVEGVADATTHEDEATDGGGSTEDADTMSEAEAAAVAAMMEDQKQDTDEKPRDSRGRFTSKNSTKEDKNPEDNKDDGVITPQRRRKK